MLDTLNQFANLILAALTALLLTATSWYAWVTHRLLREAVESRHASVRPLLWIRFVDSKIPADHTVVLEAMRTHNVDIHLLKGTDGAFVASDGTQGKSLFHIAVTADFEILNHGRGAAIAPRARFTYYSRDEQEGGLVWLRVGADRIGPNEKCAVNNAFFWTDVDVIGGENVQVTLTVTYQDSEGSLYELSRSYSAEAHGCGALPDAPGHLHWGCSHEQLLMWPYSERSAAWTPEETLPIPVERDAFMGKARTIYRRSWTRPARRSIASHAEPSSGAEPT